MGLFSRKPSSSEQLNISICINQAQVLYKQVVTAHRPDWLVDLYGQLYIEMDKLVQYEQKYPKFFVGKNTPTNNYKKIISERPEVERDFVDKYITEIEKILLKYKTNRGKQNNFNHAVDQFRYYADNFSSETISYFEKRLKEEFTEYYFGQYV